jgi:hypothetical protein
VGLGPARFPPCVTFFLKKPIQIAEGVTTCFDRTGTPDPGERMSQDVKQTWVSRRIPSSLAFDWGPIVQRGVGEVFLCEVVSIGLHGRAETVQGARSKLYPGDRILCSPGNRYATSMLEATSKFTGSSADLLSASGLCGTVLQRSDRVSVPTVLAVLRQAMKSGQPLNLRDFALSPISDVWSEPSWLIVAGSAMDSGKTTACASLISGLRRAGLRVGAAKITGTASARDYCSFRDAGAHAVFDFLDCGWPSTAGCSSEELRRISDELLSHLRAAQIDIGVLEIADGVLQRETEIVMRHLAEQLEISKVILTVRESLAAAAGVEQLARLGHQVTAISGVVSSSPLARREVEQSSGVPCIRTSELSNYVPSLVKDLDPGIVPPALDTVA